jgi:Siphovirus Gp157
MNIYTLTAAQQALQAKLEASGFDAQTITDTLESESNTEALKEKRFAYLAMYHINNDLSESCERAENRHKERKLYYAELRDKFAKEIFASMLKTKDTELIGAEFEARIKGKPAAVVIDNDQLIAPEYWTLETTKIVPATLDKIKIKEALKLGNAVEGAHLGTDKKLEIK